MKERGDFAGSRRSSGEQMAFLAFVLVAGLVIRVVVSWRDFPILFQKCVVDDALFYMNIANNIAAGNGATFDGTILTNGFHAIYALLLVPVFWLIPGNPDLTMHIALTIISVLNVLTGAVIFLIVREISGNMAGLIAAFVWIFNPFVIMISLNGVEAGVACFLLSLCIFQYVKMRSRDLVDNRNLALLGILAGLAVLGRIDAVFLMGSLGFFILVSAYRRHKGVIRSLHEPAIYSIAALVVLTPWFVWNLYQFGTIRQVSGATLPNIAHTMFLAKHKTYFSLAFLRQEAFYLSLWMKSVIRYSGGFPLFGFAAVVFIWTTRKNVMSGLKQLLERMKIIDFAIISAAMLISFYGLYFWGWHRPWYYLNVMTIATVCTGIFSGYLLENMSSTGFSGSIKKRETGILFVVLFLYFSVCGIGAWGKGLFPFQKQLYDSAVWMNENTEKDKRIGAISSGAYGYITRRTVDLLGVVNHEAYRAIRDKRIFEYILEKRIAYLVDREDMIRFFSEQFDKKGFMDRLVPVKRFGNSASDVVVYRVNHEEMSR